MVYLVGAGPGNPGLLTLRAAELLSKADVVLHDALVSPEILRMAPKSAEIIYAGKRASVHSIPQEELNELLVKKAKAGKNVVRLKGGDPYVFGRGGEEAEGLVAAKIDFEVVPGVSSVVGAACYAGIPITHRDYCSSYTVITGHEDPSKKESDIDWESMAKIPGTKVILMGVGRLEEISRRLIAGGMKASTPTAVIQWGTLGKQKSIEAKLDKIAKAVSKAGITPPGVIVIGDVVGLRNRLNWFEKRALFGQRIVVTRSRDQSSQLAHELRELSAEVLEIPTIRIVPPDDLSGLKDAILELNSYNWIVFTSPNGVTAFFDYFFKGFEDLRDIGGVRIAAVGPATAAKLTELHLKVDVMPREYVGVQVAKALADFESVENLNILLMRAEAASEDLPAALEALGGIVDDIACYKTIPETDDSSGDVANLLENGADWITFTSSSTVDNFHARFDLPKMVKKFPGTKLASIGPETSKALIALGLKANVEAKPHTIEGLVDALKKVE